MKRRLINPSPGVKIRAGIDTEIVRGLLLANGGGAVALLAFLPATLERKELNNLAVSVVIALLVFHLGIVAALVHNHLRRRCSLIYEQYGFGPPAGRLLGIFNLSQPTVCFASGFFMWTSIVFFLAGGFVVFSRALYVMTN